jgi:hypothetical protein
LKEHVANVYFKCFNCFIGRLQVFYIDVAKVDRDVAKVNRYVAHVAMTKYACCKPMFQVFQLFQMYDANVFIWIFQK